VVWSEIRDRLGFDDVDFHRGNRPLFPRKLYAPTEKDEWRKKTLQGEAHDENTWSLGGVAPHAGLFGPIEELSRWGLLLRRAMRGEKSNAFPSPQTVAKFTKRAIPKARGDWALGFMMPTKGSASCGPLFSPKSVGHTGFTGTSLWYDPTQDLLVTILSNRVHPTRENREFLQLRPKIHTWIAEELL
jgi:CubicO group peptidase (beta-lactamase class C family)